MIKNATSKQIITLIKKLLQKHGYHYSDMASILDISEASVKRVMSKGDFSLERLEKVANWFGLDFFEFINKAKDAEHTPYKFTVEQEKLFLSNPACIYIMILISVGYKFKEVQKKIEMSDLDFQKHLLILEKAQLIEFISMENIKIVARGPFKMQENGILKRKYGKNFLDSICQLINNSSPDDQLIASEFYMSDSLLLKMRSDFADLSRKYAKLARLEQESVEVKDLKPVTEIIFNTRADTWGEILK